MAAPTPGLSVREAADKLGVSPSAIRHLIAQGQVRASMFAGRVVVDPTHLHQVQASGRPVGRPFSPSTSWAILNLLAGQELESVTASRRSQLRRHLRIDEPQDLAGRLRKRAVRAFWFVHPSLHNDLATEPESVLGGQSAAERVSADLAGQGGPLEIYLPSTAADQCARKYAADAEVAVRSANVVVRKVEFGPVPQHAPGVAAAPVVALDLIESGNARAVGAGWRLWDAQIDAWRNDDPHGS